MFRKAILLVALFAMNSFANAQKIIKENSKKTAETSILAKDSLKIIVNKDSICIDTLTVWKIYKETARASYYAEKFNGRKTASGKKFDMNLLTAAHKKLPFGTILKITNLANGKSVIVEVNDRGPFIKSREIDLSKKAFLDITDKKAIGLLSIKIEIKEELIPL